MVNVCVRQHKCINRTGVERQIAVAVKRFLTAPLEQATFQEDMMAINIKQVH